MSYQEIFELSRLLQGDDREKSELQRRKLALEASINQQEARFEHELNSKSSYQEDVKKLDTRIKDAQNTAEIIELQINQASSEESKVLYSKNVFENFEKLFTERNEFLSEIEFIKCYLGQLDDKLEKIEKAKTTDHEGKVNKLKQELIQQSLIQESQSKDLLDLEQKFNNLLQYEVQVSELLRERLKTKETLTYELADLEAKLITEASVFKDLSSERDLLNQDKECFDRCSESKIDELKTEIATKSEAIQVASKYLNDATKSLASIKSTYENVMERKLSLLSDLKSVHSMNENRIAALIGLEKEIQKANIQSIKCREEMQILRSQETSFKTHKFSDKIEHLSFEVEMIASTVREMQDETQELLNKAEGLIENTEIKIILNSLSSSYKKRDDIKKKITEIERSVEEFNHHQKSYNQTLSAETDEKTSALEEDLTSHQLCLEATQSSIINLERILKEIPNLESLQKDHADLCNIFRSIECEVESLLRDIIEEEAKLESVSYEVKDSSFQRKLEIESRRNSFLKVEKERRILTFKQKKVKSHQETIAKMEADLLHEDKIFQETLLKSEKTLYDRKCELTKQLEGIARSRHAKKVINQDRIDENFYQTDDFRIPTKSMRPIVTEKAVSYENQTQSILVRPEVKRQNEGNKERLQFGQINSSSSTKNKSYHAEVDKQLDTSVFKPLKQVAFTSSSQFNEASKSDSKGGPVDENAGQDIQSPIAGKKRIRAKMRGPGLANRTNQSIL